MIKQLIDLIAKTESTKEKEAIIKKNENNALLQRVFRMAYSPRIQYGMKKWPPIGIYYPDAHQFTLEQGLDTLEKVFATRMLTGNAAIDKLTSMLERMSKDDGEIIRRVLLRDLECGAGPTIANKVWPAVVPKYPQMLASSFDEAEIIKNIKFPAFAQLKADGARCFAEVRDTGVQFFSRAGNEYKNLKKLAQQLMEMTKEARLRHPDGVLIDGELVYHMTLGKAPTTDIDFLFGEPDNKYEEPAVVDRSTSNGLANKSLEGSISQDEADNMKFQVWDYVPLEHIYDNIESKVPPFKYDVRFKALETMVEGFSQLILIENHVVNSLDEATKIYRGYVDLKLEGIILKNIDSLWENKRSKNLYKFKEVIDIAMEIIGYYAHSKDPNKLGGVNLKSLCGKITSDCGSGFTDTWRVRDKKTKKWVDIPLKDRDPMDRELLMSKALAGELVGLIADCECNGWVTSKSRKDNTVGIFLPIIKGFRFDKTSADTFEDVFGSWDQTGLK